MTKMARKLLSWQQATLSSLKNLSFRLRSSFPSQPTTARHPFTDRCTSLPILIRTKSIGKKKKSFAITIRSGVNLYSYQNQNVLSASCVDSCVKKSYPQPIFWCRGRNTVFFLSVIFLANKIFFFNQIWHLFRCIVGEHTCKRKFDSILEERQKSIDKFL